jgi:hypothetical protein
MYIKFLLPFFIVFVGYLNAQSTSNSPFSSYGLGEKGSFENAAFIGIGNCTVTYFDSTVLNLYNPATYNTLAKGQPLFSIGLTSKMSFYEQNGVKDSRGNATLEHFAMAFTLKKHFGLAFGLKPFTRKGYNLTETIAAGTDSLKYTYIGKGGTNQVFIGLSSNLVKTKNTILSVGTNISYLFGYSTNERRSQLSDDEIYGGVAWNTIRANTFYYELGAYFSQTMRENHHFTLAAAIEPAQDLKVTQDDYLFYGVIGDPTKYDTLYASAGQKGTIHLPTTSTLGFNYNFWFEKKLKNNSIRNSEIAVHINYSTTDWTKFTNSFNSSFSYYATTKLNFGIQYTPERKFMDKSSNGSFLKNVRYRAGYYQYTLPYIFNGEQVQDKGITLGFGLPIPAGQSLSCINIGFSAGKRDTPAATSFNEKYIGLNLGIILAPSVFDRWFGKRKLD